MAVLPGAAEEEEGTVAAGRRCDEGASGTPASDKYGDMSLAVKVGEAREEREERDDDGETAERPPSTRSNSSKVSLRQSVKEAVQLENMTWLNDPKVWWRHPVARISIALLILLLDMALFLEDPVNDSQVPAFLPGMGHIYSFLFAWPFSAGLLFLRLILLPITLVAGCWFGREVVHRRLLRKFLKLEMFADTGGTFLLMGCGWCCSIGLTVLIYNGIAGKEEISSDMHMEMREFSKLTQCCSVSADIVAILMIVDAVLQDREVYGDFVPRVKDVWTKACGGYFRVVAVWILAAVSFGLAVWSIKTAGVGDSYNDTRWGGMTESGRSVMVSVIIFCDLFTVMQDWDFPSFRKATEVNGRILIAGTMLHELHCDMFTRLVRLLPSCPVCFRHIRRCLPSADFFSFSITGSWLTYGPLFVVMGIDLFCTKTQVMYVPRDYGQYTRGGEGPEAFRIWTIRDQAYLAEAYSLGYLIKPEMITYAARWNVTTGASINQTAVEDFSLKSEHTGWTGGFLPYICVLPGLVMMAVFPCMVYCGNKRKSMLQALKDVAAAPKAIVNRILSPMIVKASEVAEGQDGAKGEDAEGGIVGGELGATPTGDGGAAPNYGARAAEGDSGEVGAGASADAGGGAGEGQVEPRASAEAAVKVRATTELSIDTEHPSSPSEAASAAVSTTGGKQMRQSMEDEVNKIEAAHLPVIANAVTEKPHKEVKRRSKNKKTRETKERARAVPRGPTPAEAHAPAREAAREAEAAATAGAHLPGQLATDE